MEWWTRVFKHVKFDPEIQPIIYCDNEQTVGIVKKEDERLNTKLRHVDTHQMWVRQEVQRGNSLWSGAQQQRCLQMDLLSLLYGRDTLSL
jgi:hypothetical protein